MKKIYMAPCSEQINLVAENMIAASNSLGIHSNEEVEQWSHIREGWSSDNWTEDDEE